MTETITTKEKTTNRIADRIAGTSPLVYARIAGLLLLIVAVLGPFSLLYVPSTLLYLEMPQQQPIILGLLRGYSVSVLLATHSSF